MQQHWHSSHRIPLDASSPPALLLISHNASPSVGKAWRLLHVVHIPYHSTILLILMPQEEKIPQAIRVSLCAHITYCTGTVHTVLQAPEMPHQALALFRFAI